MYLTVNLPKERDYDTVQIEKIREAFKSAEASNQNTHAGLCKRYKALLIEISDIYGADHNAFHYMERNPPPTPPDLRKVLNKFERSYNDWLDRLNQRAMRQDYRKRQNAAAGSLERAGYREGVDFNKGSAITFARKNLNEDQFGVFGDRKPDSIEPQKVVAL